jgi:hypothetical protein
MPKEPGLAILLSQRYQECSHQSTIPLIRLLAKSGIPSISNQTVQELDVITPYSVFPTVFIDNAVGMVWWKNMVDGKKMQSTVLQQRS